MKDKRKYADRSEYLKEAVTKRRKKLRDMAIKYKGGNCIICGYERCKSALEFHHIDGKNKDFGLSMNGITRSWARTKSELDKCALLCSNCHREVHEGITQLSRVIEIEK